MTINARLTFFVCVFTVIGLGAGCNRTTGTDPANANLAPVAESAPVAQTIPVAAESAEPYQEPADYPAATACPPGEDCSEQAVEAPGPPPPLPEYQQPACPGPDYLWTPGYWGYTEAGYYWVPGAWVMAPYIGALWTPPYWAWAGGRYRWYSGYWGPHIGFYGGIDYGFGYTGLGFYGGYWNQGAFVYNRAVENVDPRIVQHVYSRAAVNFTPFNRIGYNGGPGGIDRRPTPAELTVRSEARFAPLAAQMQHAHQAAADRAEFFGANRGHPAVAAMARPLATPYRAPAPAPRSWQARETRQSVPSNVRPEGPRPAGVQAAAPRVEPHGRREGQPIPANRPAAGVAQQMRPAPRAAGPVPQPRMEAHPAPQGHVPQVAQQHPAPAFRPAPQQRVESHPAPQRHVPQMAQQHPAPAFRPAPQQRVEAHPAPQRHVPQMAQQHPAPASRPAPHQRVESHPAPQRHVPQMAQQHPAPASRPAPQPRVESHPAPQRGPASAQQARPNPRTGPPAGEQHHHG